MLHPVLTCNNLAIFTFISDKHSQVVAYVARTSSTEDERAYVARTSGTEREQSLDFQPFQGNF